MGRKKVKGAERGEREKEREREREREDREREKEGCRRRVRG